MKTVTPLLFILMISAANAQTPDSTYSTNQAGLDAAPTGDTLIVADGTYFEPKADINPNGRGKNSIFLSGGLYSAKHTDAMFGIDLLTTLSISYERILPVSRSVRFTAALGIGQKADKPGDDKLIIPAHVTTLIGAKAAFLEFGIIATYVKDGHREFIQPLVGIRMQPMHSAALFRIYYMENLEGTEFDGIVLSLGMTF